MKADESSDFEFLSDAEKVSNDDEIDDEPKIKKRTRRRTKYVLNREFETTEGLKKWWNNDGSVGWEVVSRVDNEFSCTCYVGAKKHLCKHSVFVACKLGVMIYLSVALVQLLDSKQKRGRPKKAKTQSQSHN